MLERIFCGDMICKYMMLIFYTNTLLCQRNNVTTLVSVVAPVTSKALVKLTVLIAYNYK